MTILVNNIKRIFKSKGNIIIMFIMPLIFIALFLMNSFSGSQVTVGIVDSDKTKFTSILVNYVKEYNNVQFLEEKDVKKKLIDGKVNYVLRLENGFTKKLLAGEDVKLKGSSLQESNVSLPTKYFIDSFLNSTKNFAMAAKGNEQSFYQLLGDYRNGGFSVAYKDVQNEKSKAVNTVSALGFLVMSMLFLANNAAQFILDDKKNKTFYRIFAGPISMKNYMIQNIASFFLILAIQLVVIFSLMKFNFHAYFGPSILNVFVLYLLFSIVCVALGVAIASVSKDSRQAGAITTFITVPMCMLGGCFWPKNLMPELLQKIGDFTPTAWVVKATEELIGGKNLFGITTELGVLVLFAVVFILLGSWKKVDISK